MLGTWVICAKGEGVGMCVLLCVLCACWLGQSVVCVQLWPGYGGLCCSSKRTPGWLPPGSAAGWCGLELSRLGGSTVLQGVVYVHMLSESEPVLCPWVFSVALYWWAA